MQGTVRSFDPHTRAGSVFLDDGTVREFGAEAFARSGLRLLRPGQRVALRCRADGAIAALTLITFPLPPDNTARPAPADPATAAGFLARDQAAGPIPPDPPAGSLPPDPPAGSLPPDPPAGSLPPDPTAGSPPPDPAAGPGEQLRKTPPTPDG